MTTADDLFDEIFDDAADGIERLGLRSIPFTESAGDLSDTDRLRRVFTGRLNELKTAFSQFQGRDRRRLLVYGRIGSGKSAFVLQILDTLRRRRPQMVVAYNTLDDDSDLITTAFIALALKLPDDDWAQSQLHEMGLPTAIAQKERSTEAGLSQIFTAKLSEKDRAIKKLDRPTEALQQLIARARERYPDGVVIAIDDLDKQDPARVRQLMHNAQGILKGQAFFILTGHPIGMTGDLLTSERGFFDCKIELKDMDQATTQQMLAKYLASVRINPNPNDDPQHPRDVRPFTAEAARQFCRASYGKPRLFNRLGNTVLDTAIAQGISAIDLDTLRAGLQASEASRRDKARLDFNEQRLKVLLDERGTLSDDTILMEDLRQFGMRSFSQLLPLLEKLEDADLASRNELGYATEFEAINADRPFGDFPEPSTAPSP